MKKHTLSATFLLLATFGTPELQAQTGSNLVPNGGFEEWNSYGRESPKDWYGGNSYLGKQQGKRTGGDGTYVLETYTEGGSFRLMITGDEHILDVKEGGTYKFSFWYNSDQPRKEIVYSITWWDSAGRLKDKQRFTHRTTNNGWKEVENLVTTPSGKDIAKAGIIFELPAQGANKILFDDVAFIPQNAQQPDLPTPTDLSAKAIHQREITLNWTHTSTEPTQWEIDLNGQTVATGLTKPHHTLEGLDPNSDYRIAVRALRKGQKSPEANLTVRTLPMEKSADSPDRIPYLRTIRDDGRCDRRIKPYWNDLANKNAAITYRFDGKPLLPDADGMLVFPRSEDGDIWENHILHITVDEGEGRKWRIRYRLSIKKS